MLRSRYILLIMVVLIVCGCSKNALSDRPATDHAISEPTSETETGVHADPDASARNEKDAVIQNDPYTKQLLRSLSVQEEISLLQEDQVLKNMGITQITPQTLAYNREDLHSIMPLTGIGKPISFTSPGQMMDAFPADTAVGLLNGRVYDQKVLLYLDSHWNLILDTGTTHWIAENQKVVNAFALNDTHIAIISDDWTEHKSVLSLFDLEKEELRTLVKREHPERILEICYNDKNNLVMEIVNLREDGSLDDAKLHVYDMQSGILTEMAALPYPLSDLVAVSDYVLGIRQLTNTQHPSKQSFHVFDCRTNEMVDTRQFGSLRFSANLDKKTQTLVIAEPENNLFFYDTKMQTIRPLRHPENTVGWRLFPMYDGFVLQTRSNHFLYLE